MSWIGWWECLVCREKFRSTSTGGGVIQDTASSAALCALLAARERATNIYQQQEGMRWATGRVRVDANAFVARRKRR